MKTIAFVDDDERELARFERALSPYFNIVTGFGYEQCIEKLKREDIKAPDLWVLDLYFPKDGVTNTTEQRDEMNCRFQKLEASTREFKSFLESIGQGAEGGIELLQKCKANNAPVIFLTRKGTLDDAIKCFDKGAKMVLKKPGPASIAAGPGDLNDSYDKAINDSAHYLNDKFAHVISKNSHWQKQRHIYMFFLGILVSVIIKEVLGLLI